jgi:protein-S-isoprenylcysteine O-methyltransferase Ste14
MELITEFTLSWSNAFWFSLLFLMSNSIILKVYPSHYKKRVLKIPKFESRMQKILSILNFFLFQGLLIVILFLPLKTEGMGFLAGLFIFIFFYVFYILSLIHYAQNDPKKPVTHGVYKFSRNPQQISTIFMWTGIALMTGSLMILFVCFFQFITVYPTFKAQENECLKMYGKEYETYMKEVPAYFKTPRFN